MAKELLYITLKQASERYDFSCGTLSKWRRSGCPILRRPIDTKQKGKQHLYPVPDLERIRKSIKPIPNGRFNDAAGVWLTGDAAEAEFGFLKEKLQYWRRTNSPIGQAIQSREIFAIVGTGTQSLRRIPVYLLRDLEEIARRLQKSSSPQRDWLTESESTEEFKFSAGQLWRYSTKGCVALRGEKLDSRMELRPTTSFSQRKPPKYFTQQKVYCRADLERIRAWIERPVSQKQWLSSLEVKEEYGFDQPLLYYWRKHCPVHGCGINAKKGPTLARNGDIREGWLFARDDLDAIREKRTESRHPTMPNDDKIPVATGARLLGVDVVTVRNMTKRNLVELGDQPLRSEVQYSYQGHGHLFPHTYISRQDIEKIRTVREQGRPDEIDCGGEKFVRDIIAARRLGLSQDGLRFFTTRNVKELRDKPLRAVNQTFCNKRGRPYSTMYVLLRDIETIEASRNGSKGPDVEPPAIADVPPEHPAEIPVPRVNGKGESSSSRGAPPRRPGRPKQTARDREIRERAKTEGLVGQPALLSRRINEDGKFVERYGEVTKGTVRGVLNRAKKRAQKS